MNHTILIHGAPEEEEFRNPQNPSPSNANWFPWLQKHLCLKNQISTAPEMPTPYDPIYEEWVAVFEQFTISDETTLVGHSCGGGFLLRYLSEHRVITPKRVFLIAPWLDPEPHDLSTNFFSFTIDATLPERVDVHIFTSSDDFEACLKSLELIEQAIPTATYHRYTDRGHFDTEAKCFEFPELLDVILK